MKTGTIVAIIVAAVVVAGVCVGIPLSGVLNGTSGTPGDTPVQPTEPPVETPPTPTPTSTPMVSFSGGSGYSSSSGSSSLPPVAPPADSETQKVLAEQDVPDDGTVAVDSKVIEDWIVSEMTMKFPTTYDGKVTFSEIPDTVTPPSNALLAVNIDLSGDLVGGVEIIFTVPISSLPSGFGVDDASLYHYGASGWTTLPTTYEVSTDGSEVTYTAIADDFSPFALAFKDGGAVSEPVEPTPAPHEHQWVVQPIDGDKHQEICAECGEVKSDSSADCTIVYTSFEGLNPPTHNKTCVTCGRDDGGFICGNSGITFVAVAENPAYHNKTCGDCGYVLEANLPCDLAYETNSDSTHKVTCDECDYEVLDAPCTGSFTYNGGTGHAGTCDKCEGEYTSAECASFTYTSEGSGLHTKKCDTCGHEYTGIACDQFEYVSDNGSHTQNCVQCEQAVKTEKCSIMYEYNGANGVHTHTGICSVCQKPHTTDCVVGTPKPEPKLESHSTFCSVCKELLETVKCTNFDTKPNDEGYTEKVCQDCNEPYSTVTVATAAQLQEFLAKFTDAGSGNSVVTINGDITLGEGETWSPIMVDGYGGADVVTIKGNGHSISGLNAPLFAGGFAGGSGIVIEDLTIKDSIMISSHGTGSGAFVECADSMDVITLTNCHLINTTLTSTNSESRTGGLVGYATGYVGAGEVFAIVTITGCSVEDCEITGGGSVAGIIGHTGANKNTKTTITDCTVKDSIITSNKVGSYRVGVVIGTANGGDVIISGITNENNTVSQPSANSEKVNDFVGRFALNGTGDVTIDGVVTTA